MNSVMMIVDDFSCLKVSKFLKTKSSVETASALESYIAIYITPEQLSIRAIRTDHGDEFERELQRIHDQLCIQHQHPPPDMPKYTGVAERWIGLLRGRTIALLGDLAMLTAVLRKEMQWVKARNYFTDVVNTYATTSNCCRIIYNTANHCI